MALPENVEFAAITGRVLTQDGTPAAGSITFTADIEAILSLDEVIVMDPVVVQLDDQGEIEVQLIASDSPNISPRLWTYTATFDVENASLNSFTFRATAGSSQDITELVGIQSSGGIPTAFRMGPPGPPGPAGPQGLQGIGPWVGTQAQYDALESYDSNTLYLVI